MNLKKNILILFLFVSINSISQNKLNFNSNYIQSEDKWIAFPADSLGNHIFGFIYMDPQAGLTFDLTGSFSIEENGNLNVEKNTNSAIKYRLQPSTNLVAQLPKTFLNELNISKNPEWLIYYSKEVNSTEDLYTLGYNYNAWQSCDKALGYLEKAYKIDPNIPHINIELAYSYNCLKKYSEALTVLEKAVKSETNNAYFYKELLYAQVHNNKLENAIKTYNYVIKNIKDTRYNSENAYNIAQEYHRRNDLKKFENWVKKTNLDEDLNFGYSIKQLRFLFKE